MQKINLALATALFGLILTGSASAANYLLTFDPANACDVTCTTGDFISSHYGSVPGVQISYSSNGINGQSGLRWWGNEFHTFGDLPSAAWSSPTQYTDLECCSVADITFMVAPGSTLTLNSWDIAAWKYHGLSSSVSIFDLSSNLIWTSGILSDVTTTGHTGESCNNCTTTTGYRLEFGPTATNVGISNINFSVGSVPEPASWALMITGIGLAGAALRRRRQPNESRRLTL